MPHEDRRLGHQLVADAEGPEDDTVRRDLIAQVQRWVRQLSEAHRLVLSWRYGLDGNEHATLNSVGQRLGVSRERARQLQAEALQRLRSQIEAEGLDDRELC